MAGRARTHHSHSPQKHDSNLLLPARMVIRATRFGAAKVCGKISCFTCIPLTSPPSQNGVCSNMLACRPMILYCMCCVGRRYFGFLAENDVWQYATMKEPHIIHKIPCSWDIILYGGGPGLYSGSSSRSNRAFDRAVNYQPHARPQAVCFTCALTLCCTLTGLQHEDAAARPFA